jgi:hypothetical protein
MKVIPWTCSATRFRVNLMKVIPWTRSATKVFIYVFIIELMI